jgi:hypothetical protein
VFLPADEAAAPVKGAYFQLYRDAWWAVHPGKGLVFYSPKNRHTGRRRNGYRSPQCNTDERITRALSGSNIPFEIEVRQFPMVFVPVDISAYRGN